MTLAHHPRAETLAALAAGSLPPGPSLILSTHLAGCPACRDALRVCEAVGGAVLDALEPSVATPDLFARTLARIDAAASQAAPQSRQLNPRRPPPADIAGMPAPLLHCDIGPWRFVQPGFRVSRVRIPEAPEANVLLLKIAPGMQMPQHGHAGVEYTQVLKGAFSDAGGRYGPGDCVEADEDLEHVPVAELGSECICLAAIEGRLRLHSRLARMIQPLFGF